MQPFGPPDTHPLNRPNKHVESLSPEYSDYEEHLQMNLDNSLSYNCRREKCSERDAEMPTSNACQIEERIRNGGA
jgi:hypothetical protein